MSKCESAGQGHMQYKPAVIAPETGACLGKSAMRLCVGQYFENHLTDY